jgi:hypothetical protein
VAFPQGTLRSVDSEDRSRAIEPRECYPRETSLLYRRGPRWRTDRARCDCSRRGRRTRQESRRVLQEPGSPGFSPVKPIWQGAASDKAPGPPSASGGRERRTRTHFTGTAARRQRSKAGGRPGVGALHSTGEAGERVPHGPRGGKGAPGRGAVGGKHVGGIELR